MNYTIKNDYYTAIISDVGAELLSLKDRNGKEHLWIPSADNKVWTHPAAFLYPICSRLVDNCYYYEGKRYEMAMHGFIKDTVLDVTYQSDAKIVFSVIASMPDVYPFKSSFSVEYELAGDKCLVKITIENLDNKEMPYMFGWHPGFTLHNDDGQEIEDYELHFGNIDALGIYRAATRPNAVEYPLVDGSYKVNEDEIREHDTLIFGGHNNFVKMFAKGHPFCLDFSWSDNLPYLCVWKSKHHEENFLCLEPWSNIPGKKPLVEDFATKPMSHLPAGEKAVYTYEIKVTV